MKAGSSHAPDMRSGIPMVRLGQIHSLWRYPVKSMAGISTESASLGWHGLQGDRRFAFRRSGDTSSFPLISASKIPELLLCQPMGFDGTSDDPAPAQIRMPDGTVVPLWDPLLTEYVSQKLGYRVELMRFRQGFFDDASVSVIDLTTVSAIGREAGLELDIRRFRPNIVVSTDAPEAFAEDGWIGGSIVFGKGAAGPVVNATMRDLRCVMINLDPDTAEPDPRIMKAAVRLNKNYAGMYGNVARTGTLVVGDPVWLIPGPEVPAV